jgi:anaerobic selenocysteine-containing dehydrogenase
MNSTFGNESSAEAQTSSVFLHTEDAKARGIENGDRVRVFNQRGSCTLIASVDGVVRPGVVWAPSVRWNKRTPDHHNVNALTSDRLTDIGGGPTFYSCLVNVEKCGD